MENKGKIMIALYIGIALIALFLIYKIFAGIGLIKTKAKKQEIAAVKKGTEDLRTSPYFNIYNIKDKIFKKLGENLSAKLADDLHKAVRGAGTNEERIFAVFGSLYNKWNIAELAGQYSIRYKDDLKQVLLTELTDKEKATITFLINKLPNQ